jgi:cytochrome oxidase Cu insertion factor (SCO1/SenC/PrrC family)
VSNGYSLTGGSPTASSKKQTKRSMMKPQFATLCFSLFGFFALASGQENPPATKPAEPVLGLDTGSPAPAFTLSDQFGHQQSNETLKGSKGTVLLFFRSADW